MRTLLLLFLFSVINGVAHAQATIEMYSGGGNFGNGPTTSVSSIVLQKSNGANSTISVSYSLSNQQFSSVEGISGFTPGTMIGAQGAIGSNSSVPSSQIYRAMNFLSSSGENGEYTACRTCSGGIDVNNNYAVNFLNCTDALMSGNSNAVSLSARVYYSDLTFTFSQPVTNPVMHVTDLGGSNWFTSLFSNGYQGYSTELEMASGYSFSELSGTGTLSVSSGLIRNSSSKYIGYPESGNTTGGVTRYDASGSVVINGSNITSFKVRLYLQGDGGNGNAPHWAGTASSQPGVYGDNFMIGFSMEEPVTLVNVSGNVFNDPDAANVNNSTGVTNLVPAGIYANLVNASGIVVATTPVNTNGTFNFSNVASANGYTVSLSTTPGTVGSTPPAVSIPNGWVKTGEFNGTPNTGNDGDRNGTSVPFNVGTVDVTNINFAIEQLPTPGNYTAPSQPNPGGTTCVPVPASYFSATDPDNGFVISLRITAFPSNTTSITVNGVTYTAATFPSGGIILPTNPNGTPTASNTICVDPIDGAVTVSIPYKVTDNAGFESLTTGSVNLPFTLPAALVNVSGNVFNDPDANNVNNSTGVTNLVPAGIYANLVNSSGVVVASTPVNTNGTFSFANVPSANGYTVSLSTTPGTAGSTPPPVAIPNGWVKTGEFNGTPNTGNDGNINSISAPFNVSTVDVTNINFAIEQLPTPGNYTAPSQPNPGGTTCVPVPASYFSATDPDNGFVISLRITAFPSNTTSMIVNNVLYTAATFPSGGIVLPTNPNGTPTAANTICVDPIDGAVTVSIPYKVTDNAGFESLTTGSVNLPFTTPAQLVNVSGNVFNDPDAINVNNSTGVTNLVPAGIYANLVNNSGLVIATTPVNTNGTFSFANVPGANGYTVSLSASPGTVGSAAPAVAIPAGWVKTGEFNGPPNSGNDGNINSISAPFNVGTVDVTNINFAIEQLPTPGNYTAPARGNPGGNICVTFPNSYFYGTDPDNGFVTQLRITAFPSNTNNFTINGVTYTAANFPPQGLIFATNPAGVPLLSNTFCIDPVDGATLVNIPYKVTDNAGFESLTTGSVKLPFTITLPVVLTDFSGTLNNKKVDLNWATSSEINSAYFAVERSADGSHFTSIASIPATQSANGSYYKYTDSLPIAGFNYYRLKMVDKDGSFKYSKIILVTVNNAATPLSIAPNPFNDAFTISIDLKNESDINIIVNDANGKAVFEKKTAGAAGRNSIPVTNLARLPQGIYFISIITNKNSYHQKLLKAY